MTIDEHQTKPAILEGLADWLRYIGTTGKFGIPAFQWAAEVDAIQSALTQVGEEQ